jgi:hypothetical protein
MVPITASNVLKLKLREKLETVSRLHSSVSHISAVNKSKMKSVIMLAVFTGVKYCENEVLKS